MSTIRWTQDHAIRTARWQTESAVPPPRRIVLADDRMPAATARRLAARGTAILWQGDFHNARQLLRAMARRLDRAARPTTFHEYRGARHRRALILSRLLVLLDHTHALTLRRAPDVRAACTEAYGPPRRTTAVPLRELLGVLGAHQWRRNGIHVPALDARIHPHFGVFAPTRGGYVDLVARAPLPPGGRTAFDLGTGTGVLAAVLARRGYRVTATDINPRALTCARDTARLLGLTAAIHVTGPCLYPPGRADLVVCNPPWLPGTPASTFERAVYDENGAMLHDVLTGLRDHLEPGGEAWLVLSDLAERLGLRTRADLLTAIGAAGLTVLGEPRTAPRHPRAADPTDPLHAARAGEVISLWRLAFR